MTRARRWIAGAAALVALLAGGLAWLVYGMLPSDAQLAAEIEVRFEKASGIGLRVGSAHWALRPSPVVVLQDLATAQSESISVRRVVVRPRLRELWNRKVAIDAIEIDGAVVPRASARAFRGRWEADDAAMVVGAWTLTQTPVERLSLRDVVWVDRRGIALAYDADVRFDPHWRPREAELRRPDAPMPAKLHLEREGDQDRWRALIDIGGGTWNGSAEMKSSDKGRLRLVAQLEARGVDITALVGTFGRHSAIEGKLRGETTIDAEGNHLSDLVRTLHTRTRFTVAPANIQGYDLASAVSTGKKSRGGRTPLDSLGGTLDTQATDDGVVLRYSGLQARSGVLTASGNLTVINRRLNGEVAVDLVDGVVGVPLKLGGTLDAPEISLTGAALAGAAVGTAVLPGVGTAIGARIGQQMDKLLGTDEPKKPVRPPAAPSGR